MVINYLFALGVLLISIECIAIERMNGEEFNLHSA